MSETVAPEVSVVEQQRADVAASNVEPAQPGGTPASGEEPAQNTATSEAPEGTSGDDGGNPAPARGKNWAARKIDQLTREREQALAQNAQLTAVVQRIVGATPQPGQAGQPAVDDRGPQRGQFADYEQYLEARAEWKADRLAQQRIAQYEQHRGQQMQQAAVQQQAQTVANDFQSKLTDGAKRFTDWHDLAASDDAQVPLGHGATLALTQAQDPAGVVYWLMKNPTSAQAFSVMNALQAAHEIGRIEAGLKAPSAPSTAPRPGKPAGVRGGVPGGFRDDMSMEEFVAARRKKG